MNSNAEQQLRADLDWCLHSQPLMSPQRDACYPPTDWFDRLPDGIALPDIRARRLGIRFEEFFAGWIREQPQLELLAHNLPVRDATRTIGEFDLLVRNQESEIEHWELACKFYLSPGDTPDAVDMGRWHGPNPTDTLHDKITRLEEHQLKLGLHPAAVELLATQSWPIRRTRGLVKGRLFYPLTAFQAARWLFPAGINPDHERGWWISMEDFASDQDLRDKSYFKLNKINWLSLVSNVEADDITGHAALCEQLCASRSATCHVARMARDSDGRYRETSRGFIVSDAWMNAAGAG